jgi:YVTN family beta-propeller protein
MATTSDTSARPMKPRRRTLLLSALLGLPLARAAAQARPGAVAAPAASAAPPPQRPPIFVLNSQDANVSVIDPQTWEERLRIPTGKEPHHLYLTPDERSVIVANAASDSLTFIDPRTAEVQRTLKDVPDPYHLRFSPDMRWLVTAANRLDQIDIYRWQPGQASPLALARRLRAPRTPSHLAIDSRSSVVYVTLQDSDEIVAIDLATLEPRWKTKVGRMPADLFLTRDDRHLLVGLTGDRHVEVLDVSGPQPSRVRRIETGAGAHAFRSRGDGRHLFVSNRVANTVSIIDLRDFSVAAQLPGPGGPDCMEVMADGRTLLLTSRWSGRLTVIDVETRQVVRQVRVGRSPHGVWTLDHAPRG